MNLYNIEQVEHLWCPSIRECLTRIIHYLKILPKEWNKIRQINWQRERPRRQLLNRQVTTICSELWKQNKHRCIFFLKKFQTYTRGERMTSPSTYHLAQPQIYFSFYVSPFSCCLQILPVFLLLLNMSHPFLPWVPLNQLYSRLGVSKATQQQSQYWNLFPQSRAMPFPTGRESLLPLGWSQSGRGPLLHPTCQPKLAIEALFMADFFCLSFSGWDLLLSLFS